MSFMPFVAAALTLGSVALAPMAEAQRRGNGYPDARFERPGRGDDGRFGDQRRRDNARADRRCGGGSVGSLLGALAGRAINKSSNSGYCR